MPPTLDAFPEGFIDKARATPSRMCCPCLSLLLRLCPRQVGHGVGDNPPLAKWWLMGSGKFRGVHSSIDNKQLDVLMESSQSIGVPLIFLGKGSVGQKKALDLLATIASSGLFGADVQVVGNTYEKRVIFDPLQIVTSTSHEREEAQSSPERAVAPFSHMSPPSAHEAKTSQRKARRPHCSHEMQEQDEPTPLNVRAGHGCDYPQRTNPGPPRKRHATGKWPNTFQPLRWLAAKGGSPLAS